jgi:CDP-diacylglycerol--serine O-phosphatidyltransferase
MDPLLPRLEDEERRRRRRLLFRHNKIPVRMLVPNFFTLLSLCAGLTAIRMAIEQRYEYAIALVVIAALLDGVDGRLARALKAQSRFGAELDSLADFVNFGVAPAVIVFIWGLGGLPRGFGWIVAMVFAIATGLRLAPATIAAIFTHMHKVVRCQRVAGIRYLFYSCAFCTQAKHDAWRNVGIFACGYGTRA